MKYSHKSASIVLGQANRGIIDLLATVLSNVYL